MKNALVENVEVGTPATYYIGSDRYATEVLDVVYYKSGQREGFVKEIICGARTFRPYLDSRGEVVWQPNAKTWYAGVVLGYAEDYRDPHF